MKKYISIILILLSTAIYATTNRYGDIIVQHLPSNSYNDATIGYTEQAFKISNFSDSESYKVKLALPVTSDYSRGASISSLSKTVIVSPGSELVVGLLHPVGINGSGALVYINNILQARILDISFDRSRGNYYYNNDIGILLSDNLGFDLQVIAEKNFKNSDIDFIDSENSILNWSTNYLAYTTFAGIVISADDYLQAPNMVKTALIKYVETGGVLSVIGEVNIPELKNKKKGKLTNGIYSWNVGFGKIHKITEDASLIWRQIYKDSIKVETKEKAKKKRFGKGKRRSKKVEEEDITIPGLDLLSSNGWNLYKAKAQKNTSASSANKALPVVDTISIPIRGLFFLMLCFVIIIGPVNIFILARKKKKILILFTVPVISISFAFIIVLYSFISEGLSGKSASRSLTVLDEISHRATTYGVVGYYMPIAPWGGMKFDNNSYLRICKDYSYRETASYGMDWTNGQLLTSGWIQARLPVHFKIRKSETRRERLSIMVKGDDVWVTNNLGSDIDSVKLILPTQEGEENKLIVYTAKNIMQGVKVKLIAGNPIKKANYNFLSSEFHDDVFSITKKYNQSKNLAPGRYLAKLKQAPFIEKPLENISEVDDETLIYGIMGDVKYED